MSVVAPIATSRAASSYLCLGGPTFPQHPISEPRQAVYDDATRPDDVASSFDAHVDG